MAPLDLDDGRSRAVGHGALCLGRDHPVKGQERELIEAALTRSRGRVAGSNGAAAKLGIPASTLESKIRQLGIEKRKFTPDSQ